jgi:hydrogenase/urease accessory protein HupE
MGQLLLFFLLLSSYLFGHTSKPAYLEIKAIGDHHYITKWKVPLVKGENISIIPKFPSFCQEKNITTYKDTTIQFISSRLNCKETLIGKSISIQNIETDLRTVIFHFSEDTTSYFTEFNPTHPILTIKSHTKKSYHSSNYIFLGIKHILLGYDHLLFVLALLLLIQNKKTFIQTISAFTLTHSISLGASALGYILVHEVFIELLIALSIVILAVELHYFQKGRIGLSSKYPWSIALFFGLIHGFGFANVFSELTLPKEHFIQALLFFNIGIELGQLLFILLLIITYHLSNLFIYKKYFHLGKTFLVYAIGTLASYWFIERLLNSLSY